MSSRAETARDNTGRKRARGLDAQEEKIPLDVVVSDIRAPFRISRDSFSCPKPKRPPAREPWNSPSRLTSRDIDASLMVGRWTWEPSVVSANPLSDLMTTIKETRKAV